ncbi:hypothetical protein [Ruminococcus sp.]|uniref:hypothetical protein n=1 Tax=Ruminococcus sp. TaxID=41978 RepID=UPI003EFECC47
MSTEKVIKNQAKDSLKNNWSVIIAAVLAVCALALLIDALMYGFGFFTKSIDTDTGLVKEGKKLTFTLIACGALAVTVLISPLINGLFKMFGNTSLYNRTEISDLFFFFKGAHRYFKTLIINITLLFIFSVLAYGLDVYSYACYVLGASLKSGFQFDINTFILIGAFLISVIIKVLIYLLFVHFPLVAYSFNDSMPASKYMFGYIGFSFRHFAKTFKLVLSFFGWIVLSCALVVPAFYALPYLMTSMTTSAKWLFSLERNRGVI